MAWAQTYTKISPRPSTTVLYQSLSTKAHLVACRRRSFAGLNCTDWAAFEVLNIGNPTVSSLPHGARSLDGLFQAFAVRSGGFYVVPIANLRIGLLILYVIMMYISVYPVVITMRSSNVYEERSLGIYVDDTHSASIKTIGHSRG
ncbi:hypothetical protein ABVK25_012168 [Lepraria finkii]|uniref:Uncharacterized protein n=1 Tax=Lepraria finkii TaxID=1340010 RepID=A0ABR4AHW5_9LECA